MRAEFWGVEKVLLWIQENKVLKNHPELVKIFQENDVDGMILLDLDNKTLLNDLQIQSFGVRRHILNQISLLKTHDLESPQSAAGEVLLPHPNFSALTPIPSLSPPCLQKDISKAELLQMFCETSDLHSLYLSFIRDPHQSQPNVLILNYHAFIMRLAHLHFMNNNLFHISEFIEFDHSDHYYAYLTMSESNQSIDSAVVNTVSKKITSQSADSYGNLKNSFLDDLLDSDTSGDEDVSNTLHNSSKTRIIQNPKPREIEINSNSDQNVSESDTSSDLPFSQGSNKNADNSLKTPILSMKKTLVESVVIGDSDSAELISSNDETEVVSVSSGDFIISPFPLKRKRNIKAILPASLKTKNKQDSRKHKESEIFKRVTQLKKTRANDKICINVGHKDDVEDVFVDKTVGRKLHPHQIAGIQFLWRSLIMITDDTNSHQGSCLAHAMGLGKTLTTLVFLFTVKMQLKSSPLSLPVHLREGGILVVCPSSVCKNCADKIRILGNVYLFGDSMESRVKLVKKWKTTAGILIVSYSLLRKIFERNEAPLDSDSEIELNPIVDTNLEHREFLKSSVCNFASIVVCDESQEIKNPTTDISNILKSFKTRTRICLTGTPLQNHLEEYYALVDFIIPGFLGTPEEFRNQYKNPISNGLFSDSTVADIVLSKQRQFVLTNILEPVIHRCDMEILIKSLKPKSEYKIFLKLTSLQMKIYERYIQLIKESTSRLSILTHDNPLGLICSHPFIFREYNIEKVKNESSEGPKSVASSMHEFMNNLAIDPDEWSNIKQSKKILVMLEIVRLAVSQNDKVIIFSRSIPTIDYIERLLKGKFKIQKLTGSTSSKQRQDRIDDFNSVKQNFNVFLISTRAGGVGVNIVGANRVILFDSGWNPSSDAQAISRAYRYGQEKSVYVYHLLMHDSFEHKMLLNNVFKLNLARQVVDKKNTENLIGKKAISKYFAVPTYQSSPEITTRSFQDTIMTNVFTKFNDSIIDVVPSEEFVKESKEGMSDLERKCAEEALDAEIYRRKNKLSFSEVTPGLSSVLVSSEDEEIAEKVNPKNNNPVETPNDIFNVDDGEIEEAIETMKTAEIDESIVDDWNFHH